MTTKLTITIARDPEQGKAEDMERVLQQLAELEIRPEKLTIQLVGQDAPITELRNELASALTDRPVGVNVAIKRTIDEEIPRRRAVLMDLVELPERVPMDSFFDAPIPPAGSLARARLEREIDELDPDEQERQEQEQDEHATRAGA